MAQAIRLVILDRDGVINEDSDNYIRSPNEWIPIPSSLKAIQRLNQLGIPVVVATNQSGVGRGYYTLETLGAIHQRMITALQENNAFINDIYLCPHHPDDQCHCRKPKPGLLEQIKESYPDEFKDAIFVGDSWSDLQAGDAAGIRSYLVLTGKGQRTLAKHADSIPTDNRFENLSALVDSLFF